MKLNNKVAVVTGGGKRLGKQIALALAEDGFNVIVNYHTSKLGAQKTVAMIQAGGCDALAVKADVSKKKEVDYLIKSTIKKFGRIDLLVNNAAIFIDSPLQKTSEKIWNQTIDSNLKGTFLCCQSVSSLMLKQKMGRIINIASLGGIQAWKEHLPYSVSKAGVIMLTRCLAKSLAPNILVNAIAPGTIILEDEEDPQQKHIPQEKIPLRKYGKPSDITDLVVFLATTAQYITGQTFVVDGGRSV